MKKLILLVMLISGVAKAQTFDFSCGTNYTIPNGLRLLLTSGSQWAEHANTANYLSARFAITQAGTYITRISGISLEEGNYHTPPNQNFGSFSSTGFLLTVNASGLITNIQIGNPNFVEFYNINRQLEGWLIESVRNSVSGPVDGVITRAEAESVVSINIVNCCAGRRYYNSRVLDLSPFTNLNSVNIQSQKTLQEIIFAEGISIGNARVYGCDLRTLDVSNINFTRLGVTGNYNLESITVRDVGQANKIGLPIVTEPHSQISGSNLYPNYINGDLSMPNQAYVTSLPFDWYISCTPCGTSVGGIMDVTIQTNTN